MHYAFVYEGEILFDLDLNYYVFLEARMKQYHLDSYIRLSPTQAEFFKNKPDWHNHYLIFCDFLLFIERYGCVHSCDIRFDLDRLSKERVFSENGKLYYYSEEQTCQLYHSFESARGLERNQFMYLMDCEINLNEKRKSVIDGVETPLLEVFMKQPFDFDLHKHLPVEYNIRLLNGSLVPSCEGCIHRLESIYNNGCFICHPKKTNSRGDRR